MRFFPLFSLILYKEVGSSARAQGRLAVLILFTLLDKYI